MAAAPHSRRHLPVLSLRDRMSGFFRTLLGIVAVLLVEGCLPTLGVCDEEEAKRVYYLDSEGPRSGIPAYAGQALIQVSCGNGQFCHAPAAQDRYGVPQGLDFDIRVACESEEGCSEEAREELERNRMNVFVRRRLIAQQVERGAMPPGGIGATVVGRAPRFRTGPDRGTDRMPSVESREGKRLLDNWLACGSPIVTETVSPAAGMPAGTSCGEDLLSDPGVYPECIVRGEGVPPEPNWQSIYERVMRPLCAEPCHSDAEGNEDQLRQSALDLSTFDAAYEALVDEQAKGGECDDSDATLVVPGDAASSLLVQKMEPDPPCGAIMPIGTPLSQEVIDVIRQWIDEGAELGPIPAPDGGVPGEDGGVSDGGVPGEDGGLPDGGGTMDAGVDGGGDGGA